MNCVEVRGHLEPFLEGKISGDAARRIRTHLALCPSCSSELSEADRIEALVARDPAPEPSSDLQERFHRRLQAHRDRRTAAWPGRLAILTRHPYRLATVGVLAAAVAIAVYLAPQRLSSPPAPEEAVEINLAENLPLLEDMAVIENLDLIEDFEAVQDLGNAGRTPASPARHNP